jgi:hypothetical protein
MIASRRHADRIANYWLTRLRDSPPPKRLNFIYLVNDIVQNARARKRAEFPDAFSPLMAEAIQTAYRSSPPEIQTKIKRVVEVWRTRNVFETPILDAIEARIDEVDKSKGGSGKKTLMGQSLFGASSGSTSGGGSLPKELETLAPLQITVTKENISARPTIDSAQAEYTKLNDPNATLPSPPVYAARLSSLIKALVAAESSVSASIKARKALISDLERILQINRDGLAKDEETYLTLESRKASTEAKKREVEDGILRGLTTAESNTVGGTSNGPAGEADGNNLASKTNENGQYSANAFLSEAPEIEQFTDDEGDTMTGAYDQDPIPAPYNDHQPAVPTSYSTSDTPPVRNSALAAALAEFSASGGAANLMPGLGADYSAFLPSTNPSSTPRPPTRQHSGSDQRLNGKRRKTSHGADDAMVPDLGDLGAMGMDMASGGLPGLGMDSHRHDVQTSLDEDVSELIRQESAGNL